MSPQCRFCTRRAACQVRFETTADEWYPACKPHTYEFVSHDALAGIESLPGDPPLPDDAFELADAPKWTGEL